MLSSVRRRSRIRERRAGKRNGCRASRQKPSGPPESGGKPGATTERDEGGAGANWRGKAKPAAFKAKAAVPSETSLRVDGRSRG